MTISIEHNPCWDADSVSAGKERNRTLWELKIHYNANESVPLDRILSEMIPVLTLNPYLKKKKTPWPLVRERTIPTERPLLI
jgi:hypothetical protein